MNCGTKLPDGAKFCMNCGSTTNFENTKGKDYEKTQLNESELTRNAEEIEFEIVDGCVIRYDKNLEQSMALFGQFLERAYSETDKLKVKYTECGSIEKVLQVIPDMAQTAIDDVLNGCLKILYDNGINMSGSRFIDKYYYEYKIDYEPYYRDAVQKFAEIKKNKEALAAFRSAQRESRGRWQGGGFGISGAIKGAVTASVMNIGTDFVRSFGDAATTRSDNEQIDVQLQKLYNDEKIKGNLCWGVWWCIMNAYYALMQELGSNNTIKVIHLDKRGADELFENTNNFAENREEYVQNIIRCITKYPGEKRFYEAIMPEIMKHNGTDFDGFLQCWKIDFLLPEYKEKKEQDRIDTEHSELFDEIFEIYMEKYEKKYGDLDKMTPEFYYEVMRPSLMDLYNKLGYKKQWTGMVSDNSCYKEKFLEYIGEVKKLKVAGDLCGEKYIASMPKCQDIRQFFYFINYVENNCLYPLLYFTPGESWQEYFPIKELKCSDLWKWWKIVSIDTKDGKKIKNCANELIMMQQWDEGKGNFLVKAVATLTITENHLIMLNKEKKNKYCIIKSEQVRIIKKIGKEVFISDGVQTGCIEFDKRKNNYGIVQFLDILFCMLRDCFGCDINMTIE